MNRGKPLRRTGFTNRGKPLRRYVGLRRSSTSRAGSGTTGEGGSVAASAGSDRCSNLIRGCHACHQVVTDNPKWAYTQGWCLREWQEPSQEPVLYRGDLVYLTDGGDVVSFEKAGA